MVPPAPFRKFITAIVVLAVLGTVLFALANLYGERSGPPSEPAENPESSGVRVKTIGTSVEGRKIESYSYGDGERHLFFVGGIHGGYEWNSVFLAYKFMDYLEANPTVIPDNLTITVLPSANPDGIYKVVKKKGRFAITDVSTDEQILASGRFNAREVDLNRNFACRWQPKSMWRKKTVSAGSKPFSEPESVAIKNFVLEHRPDAVIFWHSQANAVYASECESGILPETIKIMNIYSRASGYPTAESFDSYDITGDAEGWLASENIPAITVELRTHETIEWEKNLAGAKALFEYYLTK